jgi:hypothetical protein
LYSVSYSDQIDLLKLYFVSRNSILSMHVCRARLKKKYFKIPVRIPNFRDFLFSKMTRFIEQKLNFSLFYQSLIRKRFSENSKRKWFRRVETIIKCPRKLIFDYLLAVNPCGLQAKKLDFQRPTVDFKKQTNLDFSPLHKSNLGANGAV